MLDHVRRYFTKLLQKYKSATFCLTYGTCVHIKLHRSILPVTVTVLCQCVKVGCSRDNAIECLREKSADLLTEKQWKVKTSSGTPAFKPTIDHKFLNKNPTDLLKSGEFQKKNILLGANSHEGSYFIIYAFPERFDPLKDYNNDITFREYRDMVKQLKLHSWMAGPWSDIVSDTIAASYLLLCGSKGNTSDDDAVNYFMSLDGMLGDLRFKCPVVHMAKTHVRKFFRSSFQSCLVIYCSSTLDNSCSHRAANELSSLPTTYIFDI